MARRREFGNVRQYRSGRWTASFIGKDAVRELAPNTFETEADAEARLVQSGPVPNCCSWVGTASGSTAPRPTRRSSAPGNASGSPCPSMTCVTPGRRWRQRQEPRSRTLNGGSGTRPPRPLCATCTPWRAGTGRSLGPVRPGEARVRGGSSPQGLTPGDRHMLCKMLCDPRELCSRTAIRAGRGSRI